MPVTGPDLIDPRAIALGLSHVADDVWFAQESEAISYLAGGNDRFNSLEEGSFWFAHRNDCIKALVQALPPAGTIFDIGGGNGFVAAGLLGVGHSVALVEPNAEGARNARQRGVPLVVCASLKTARFHDSVMPAVGLFDVLEHVADDRAFLSELARCMTSGGMLYLTVPAWEFLWSCDDVAAGHFRRYTLSRLQALFEQTGFAVRFSSYFFSALPLPLLATRSLPSLFGRRSLPDRSYDELHARKVPAALQSIFRWEKRRIASLGRIICGTSCLVAAQKC